MSGTLNPIVVSYNNWPAESTRSDGELISGALTRVVGYVNYTGLPEQAISSGELISGSIKMVRIFYDNWIPENTLTSGNLISGSLDLA